MQHSPALPAACAHSCALLLIPEGQGLAKPLPWSMYFVLHLGHSWTCLLSGSVYLCQKTSGHQMNFSDVRGKKPPQNQTNKNKATTTTTTTTTKQGVWGVSGFGFFACRSSWSATVFGESILCNLQFPRPPKAQPLACPSHSTTLVCFLEVQGVGLSQFLLAESPAALWETQALPRSRTFPLHLSLCCQYNRTSCLPTLPLPQNEKKCWDWRIQSVDCKGGKKISTSFQGHVSKQGTHLNLPSFLTIWWQAEKRHFSQTWLGDVQQVWLLGNWKHCGSEFPHQHKVGNLARTWEHSVDSTVSTVWLGSWKIFQLVSSQLHVDLTDASVLPSCKLYHTPEGAKSGEAYNISVLGFVPLYFKLWQNCLPSASSFWIWTNNMLVMQTHEAGSIKASPWWEPFWKNRDN